MSKFPSKYPPRTPTQVTLIVNNQEHTLEALIDSGADESLIDWELAKLLNLKTIPLAHPINASALDGRLMCQVTDHTEHVQVVIQNHSEMLQSP